jgi:hypothetical protein
MKPRLLTEQDKILLMKYVESENKKLDRRTRQPGQATDLSPPLCAVGRRDGVAGRDFRHTCIGGCGEDAYTNTRYPDDVPVTCDVCLYDKMVSEAGPFASELLKVIRLQEKVMEIGVDLNLVSKRDDGSYGVHNDVYQSLKMLDAKDVKKYQKLLVKTQKMVQRRVKLR